MDVAEFDKFADEYHNLHQENIRITGENPEYFAEYKIRDLRRVVNSFGVNSENILDFGMGIGNSTPFLSEYFPDYNLHGVDVSEKSLAIASERYECLGDFLVFDVKNTTFPDETFDVVFSAGVFHHVPFSEHFDLVCEVSRTLKNGGIFMIYEHNPFNPLTCHAVNLLNHESVFLSFLTAETTSFPSFILSSISEISSGGFCKSASRETMTSP